jgi:hypothetical protein
LEVGIRYVARNVSCACRRAVLFALCFACAVARYAAAQPLAEQSFNATTAGEAIAVVHASCARCDWGVTGREAAAVRILLDGEYSQHLLLARGAADSEYPITLGAVGEGTHRLRIEPDASLSAEDAGPPAVSRIDVRVLSRGDAAFMGQSMAPVLHARPNTVGRFTDLPVLMWYEVVPTEKGTQYRYSVIFTNEDGGTATDRLMATWGRTTDIEYVYGVEVDGSGKILGEEFQGPGHELPPFRGRYEARHPLMWVSTDNNMVSESGPTEIRYAPVPERFDLTNVSREVVMDRHPWTYTIAAKEMAREGMIANDATAGSGKIPDPRRFVYVEACTELTNAAVAFSVRSQGRWFDSDRGLPAFRIVRTGCFRGAVPLPEGAPAPDAVKFRAYSLPPKEGAPPPPPGAVRLVGVNQVFTVDEQDQPRPTLFQWTGSAPLDVNGDWHELPFRTRP